MEGTSGTSDHRPFFERLSRRLALPLPGFDVHLRMAPSYRLSRENLVVMADRGTEAAVAVLLYPAGAEVHLVLIQRPSGLAAHPGQISLPGGRREIGESLETTALRELHEEVGVPMGAVEKLGALSPLYIPPTDFNVYPFVFAAPSRPDFVPQPAEVEALIEVGLAELADPSTARRETRDLRGVEAEVPFFAARGHKIWGATAMILAELVEVVREART